MPIVIEQPTAEAAFEAVKTLPAIERLKLAGLIINSIPPQSIVNYSTEWSEEDMEDFSNATFELFEELESEAAHAQPEMAEVAHA